MERNKAQVLDWRFRVGGKESPRILAKLNPLIILVCLSLVREIGRNQQWPCGGVNKPDLKTPVCFFAFFCSKSQKRLELDLGSLFWEIQKGNYNFKPKVK